MENYLTKFEVNQAVLFNLKILAQKENKMRRNRWFILSSIHCNPNTASNIFFNKGETTSQISHEVPLYHSRGSPMKR
jgi:hypothetical protein